MKSRFILGLDIGTTSIKAALAEYKDGRPMLRAVFTEPSSGLRRGSVVDLALASGVLARVFGAVKKICAPALKTVYANIGTPHLSVQHSRGIVAVSRADSEIYEDDIERAIKASQAVAVSPNRMILHTLTREYIVDGTPDITDPLGLSGNRLEVLSIVIEAFAPHVKSSMRSVELAGGDLGGIVLGPLLGSRAALTRSQREVGVVLVDIGGGTTGMSVYEENKLLGVSIFPVGGGHITNDIAVGLRIPVAVAERVKLQKGYAAAKEVSARETVDLAQFSEEIQGTPSRRYIAEIIEPRLAEIFGFVNNELKALGKAGQLPGGVVLVGGGAKLPGATALAREELKLTSRLGSSLRDEWHAGDTDASEVFEDPEFVNALGLVLWGADKEGWKPQSGSPFKNLIRYFLP